MPDIVESYLIFEDVVEKLELSCRYLDRESFRGSGPSGRTELAREKCNPIVYFSLLTATKSVARETRGVVSFKMSVERGLFQHIRIFTGGVGINYII